ncbi:flavin reductase family protein [Acidobacteria bacterium AH-259-D05]|nr:flavin reductase family protein [Acidobacteria bacterium AH-259-D05]
MFYEPRYNDHGLPYNPFKACVVPRPIGWITTLSHDGIVNLAPFSISNQLAYDPPFVFFSPSGRDEGDGSEPRRKDSVINAENSGEFVYNMATYALREQVNLSSSTVPPEVDEMELCGLTKVPATLVKPPLVGESPVNLECKHHCTLTLPANSPKTVHHVVVGQVVGIHIDDRFITDGKVDWMKIQPLARMGYMDYTYVSQVFTMKPPGGEHRPGQIGEPTKVEERGKEPNN